MRNKYTDPFLEIASSQFTGCPVLFACISEEPYQLVKFFVLPFYRGRNYWPRKYLLPLLLYLAVPENPKTTKFVMQEFSLSLCYYCVWIFRDYQS